MPRAQTASLLSVSQDSGISTIAVFTAENKDTVNENKPKESIIPILKTSPSFAAKAAVPVSLCCNYITRLCSCPRHRVGCLRNSATRDWTPRKSHSLWNGEWGRHICMEHFYLSLCQCDPLRRNAKCQSEKSPAQKRKEDLNVKVWSQCFFKPNRGSEMSNLSIT